ncbi:MAG: hypothetical protein ACLTV6_14450 [Christensenellales bacterium]
MDSDDVPRADALWHLTQAAKEKRLDVAKARFRFLDDDTGELTDGPMILPSMCWRAARCSRRNVKMEPTNRWSGSAFIGAAFDGKPFCAWPKGCCLRMSCFRPRAAEGRARGGV